ncbi:hypothetical protein [Trinickia sp.]|uniref:hypothetical protein n=1 Tax=Trinickia sp. TaxID=2571163 RepID=UPI002D7EA80D|nr:hypothetical protein [Trinickia sp.]
MSGRAMMGHQVCIDLPGEPVECWAETDVTVLLRKHRDVIFDIELLRGATYSVEATEDWIYDVKKKKRVQKGEFSDGQRYHIWISRDFKGYLLLKRDGNVVQRYAMSQFELGSGNSDPKFKPAPIIISMRSNATGAPAAAGGVPFTAPSSVLALNARALTEPGGPPEPSSIFLAQQQQQWCPLPIKLAAGSSIEAPQYAHIVEVDKQSIPQEILDQVAAGGRDETAIDTNKIATRNWLLGQLAGAAAFINDNKAWISELWSERFRLMKIVHKNAGVRWYVVFTGNPRSRSLITAARYGLKHEKVLTIAGGAGSVESGAAAAWEGLRGVAKKAGLIALIFTMTLDAAEWLHDYEQIGPDGKRKKDFADLLGKLGIDFLKAGISAAIASAVVGTAVALAAGWLLLPVSAIVVGTLAVAVLVGYGIDLLDKKVDGTAHATDFVRSIGESLRHSAEYLQKIMAKDYESYPLMFVD